MTKWFLGAYAGYASFADKSSDNDHRYLRGLQEIPDVAGLELPFYNDLSDVHSDRFLRTLPKEWEYIITPLPGTMNNLKMQPEYGLGSINAEGRRAALSRMAVLHRRVHEINSRCGREAVRGIELHSAPRRPFIDKSAFFESLEELQSWDWQGATLLIEHCDAWRAEEEFVKGFLDLDAELALSRELPIQLSLNWGRSAIECKDADGVLEHIQKCAQKLGAFFFSGTSLNDPLYGSWLDSHCPLQLGTSEKWEPTEGLLNEHRVKQVLASLKDLPEVFLGIKVQPAPESLDIGERLAFLAQQVVAFERLRTEDC